MAEKKPDPKTNTMKKKPGAGDADREPLSHKHGDTVHFEHGDEEAGVTVRGKGVIVASGADGVTVATDDGREHKIRHSALRSGKKKKEGAEVKKADEPLLLFLKSWPTELVAEAAPARRVQSVPDTGTPLLMMEKGGAYVGAHTRVSKNGVVTTISPHLENRHGRPDAKHAEAPKAGAKHEDPSKHLTDAERLLAEARKREAKAHEKHDERLAEKDAKKNDKDGEHQYGDKDGDRDGSEHDEHDADGKKKKKKAPPFVKKSDSGESGDYGSIPVMVFGMVAGAASDAAAASAAPPAASGDASLAGGNPPPLPEPAAPEVRQPESLADPRASYTQRAISAFRSFWNPGT